MGMNRHCQGVRAAGQGTIEYAMVSFLLIGTGTFMATRFLPGMLTAFNDYLHGIYLMLAMPIP